MRKTRIQYGWILHASFGIVASTQKTRRRHPRCKKKHVISRCSGEDDDDDDVNGIHSS